MRAQRGFTLIELVIVIAIIGILASLAVPKMIDMSQNAKISATSAGLGSLRSVIASRYAASATGGAAASYPTYIGATDFADHSYPRNRCTNSNLIAYVTSDYIGGAASWVHGFWYVSDPNSSDWGECGAVYSGDWACGSTDWYRTS